MKLLNIIIVNYNLAESIRSLINSIQKNTLNLNYKIIVVDNNSPERDITNLQNEFPEVIFEFLNTNYGFGHANNFAIKKYKADYFFILNPDTLILNNSIFELFRFLEENNKFGIVSPLTLNEDGTVQFTYREFPGYLEEFMNLFGLMEISFRLRRLFEYKLLKKNLIEPDFVYGSALLIRDSVFEKIGYFDEDYFLFAEETDLCYRLKHSSNFKLGLIKSAKLIHTGGKIINRDQSSRIKYNLGSKLIFINKNYNTTKRNIMRYIICISLIERIVFYSLLPAPENKIKVRVYKELFKQYYSNQLVLNKRDSNE